MTDPFEQHVPLPAVAYCRQLWKSYQFNLRVVKPRRSRLGDFRVLPTGQTQITLNADLNPFAFLITYVHEVAHAHVYQHYRRPGPPHSSRWQTSFQRLMQPLLTETIFPAGILAPLTAYMAKPAATTHANPALMLALRKADQRPTASGGSDRIMLSDIPEGQSFRFAKKEFVRGPLRRTRVVCKEIGSGKSYAILAHAWVDTF